MLLIKGVELSFVGMSDTRGALTMTAFERVSKVSVSKERYCGAVYDQVTVSGSTGGCATVANVCFDGSKEEMMRGFVASVAEYAAGGGKWKVVLDVSDSTGIGRALTEPLAGVSEAFDKGAMDSEVEKGVLSARARRGGGMM